MSPGVDSTPFLGGLCHPRCPGIQSLSWVCWPFRGKGAAARWCLHSPLSVAPPGHRLLQASQEQLRSLSTSDRGAARMSEGWAAIQAGIVHSLRLCPRFMAGVSLGAASLTLPSPTRAAPQCLGACSGAHGALPHTSASHRTSWRIMPGARRCFLAVRLRDPCTLTRAVPALGTSPAECRTWQPSSVSQHSIQLH